MINSKERAHLRKLALKISPMVQIGKDGLTQNVLNQIDVELENRELVKVKVLKNSMESPRALVDDIAKKLKAEPVASIGGVFVLYRFSTKKGVKHISLK